MPVPLPDFLLAPLLSQAEDKLRAKNLRKVWNEELSDKQRMIFWGPLLQKTYSRRNSVCARAVFSMRPEGVTLPANLGKIAHRQFEKAQAAANRGKGSVREASRTYEGLLVALFQSATVEELACQKLPKDLLNLVFREGFYNLLEEWRRFRPSQVESGRSLVMAMKPGYQQSGVLDWRGYSTQESLRSLACQTNSHRLSIVAYWASERSVGMNLKENRQFRRQFKAGEPVPKTIKNSILATPEWLFNKWIGLDGASLLRDTPLVRMATGVLLEKALEDGPRSSAWVITTKHGYTIPKETLLFFFTVETARAWGKMVGSYLATYSLSESVSSAFDVLNLRSIPGRLVEMNGWDGAQMNAWTQGFLEGWGDKETPLEWGDVSRCWFLSSLKAAFEQANLEGKLPEGRKGGSRPRI